jgi:hypothetical protein
VSFTALLVATLLVLVLYRIKATIARALGWCSPMARPSSLLRHHHCVGVIDVAHVRPISFGENNAPTSRSRIHVRPGGRTSERGTVLHRLFRLRLDGRAAAHWPWGLI